MIFYLVFSTGRSDYIAFWFIENCSEQQEYAVTVKTLRNLWCRFAWFHERCAHCAYFAFFTNHIV